LARITGKAKSNLSRTLKTMEGYGLVRLERGERGRITPKVTHDRVQLDLPLTWSRKADSEQRDRSSRAKAIRAGGFHFHSRRI
jgi:predicted transcriptional regulator